MTMRRMFISIVALLQVIVIVEAFYLGRLYIYDVPVYDLQAQGETKAPDPYATSRISSKLDILDEERLQNNITIINQLVDYYTMFGQEQALEEAQAAYHTEFLEEQQDLIEQQKQMQAELDKRVLDEIAAEGGINATTDDVVYIDEDDLADNTTSVSTSDDNVSTAGSSNNSTTFVPQATLETLGNFNVEFVCTCIDCLDQTKYPNLSIGDDCALVSSSIVPVGSSLSFTAVSGRFTSRDDGTVTDSSTITICCSDHDEVAGKAATESIVYLELT